MGADKWVVCPWCFQSKAVGLSPDAYEVLRTNFDREFREDWELFIDEAGHLYISYEGWCRRCHQGKSFCHEENLL